MSRLDVAVNRHKSVEHLKIKKQEEKMVPKVGPKDYGFNLLIWPEGDKDKKVKIKARSKIFTKKIKQGG